MSHPSMSSNHIRVSSASTEAAMEAAGFRCPEANDFDPSIPGGCLAGWFLQSPDRGATYESLTVVPPRPPDFIVPLDATTGNKVYKAAGRVAVPALQSKVLVQNLSGQTFTATGNTLKIALIAEVI